MAPLTDLAAGAVVGLAVAMPVGAVGTYLLALAARSPWRTAAAGALGVATVDGAYAVLAAAGGLGVRRWIGRSGQTLTLVAALVLVAVALWTGWSAVLRFRRPAGAGPSAPLAPRRAYGLLVAMTVVNPATLVTFVAVVLARGSSATPAGLTVALFATGAFLASACWQLLLVGGGSLLGRLLRGARGQLGVGLASAAVMLGLALGLVLE
ncbi:MAG: LysE family transporter [Friedmanniella sp.]